MLGSVLIVGGSASIAPEIIKVMASGSRRVIVTYRTLPNDAPDPSVELIQCDLSESASRTDLANSIRSSSEGIDVLLILVGAINGKNLESTSDEEITALADANLMGPARLIRDLLTVLNEGARLIILSSVSGQRGSFDPIYAATKGALIPFAKSLAKWYGKRLTITVVAPGAIEGSEMVSGMSSERVQFHRNDSPTGALLDQSDLANMIFDLAHSHWKHSNGSVISLNGGSYV